ncbi:type IV toxin-antitoxin system AbiEi family antitoxin [Microbacterium hominis]|uniref:AbiEi antitoxin C-terminal domain-containing protein n=1 Tax=Microbacterium hominis TaxID=162426 RepID=A0A7D4Q810_9MICO|nr:type IV toxin-antitoxin system AbiEi family antitoxin [Microbacterium hominis]QKJ19479.1 hypothetical protein HQM25_08970 [Microbacterium hominis]
MASHLLYFADDRLSVAELSAACLDGDLYGLGEAYIPGDAVETRALRAGSLRPLLGDNLAATHASAAWVHGALDDPPARHSVQRAVPKRLHHVIGRRTIYRDPHIGEADLEVHCGARVTTPARTLADLARTADAVDDLVAARMAAAFPDAVAAAISWLEAAPVLPHKRRALSLLRDQFTTR